MDALVAALTSTLCNDSSVARKQQAALQLRRLLSREQHELRMKALPPGSQRPLMRLEALQAGSQQGLKAGLLHSFSNEQDMKVRTSVAAAIAEVAAQCGGEGCKDWPGLLQTVFDGAAVADWKRQKSSLELLGLIALAAGGKSIFPHAAPIGTMLQTLLTTPAVDVHTRVAAMVCCEQLIEAFLLKEGGVGREASQGVIASFQALIPALVGALQSVFSAACSDAQDLAEEALQEMTNIVILVPTFFRAQLNAVCGAVVTILGAPTLPEDTRSAALEFLLNLAEEAGATVRKVPQLSETVLKLTLDLMQQYEDAEEHLAQWAAVEDKEEDEDEEAQGIRGTGANGIMRYASALGAKQAWPLFQKIAEPLFKNPDWRARAAAITVRAACCLLLPAAAVAFFPFLPLLTLFINFCDASVCASTIFSPPFS